MSSQSITLSFESLSLSNYNRIRAQLRKSLPNDTKLLNTLEFYAFYNGNLYEYYTQHRDDMIELNALLRLKLIQLSILSLIRQFKTKTLAYDYLIDTFVRAHGTDPLINGSSSLDPDLVLENLLMRIGHNEVLKLKLDSSNRQVEVTDFAMRNVCFDASDLRYLKSTDVVLRSSLIEGLEAFQVGKLKPLIASVDITDTAETTDNTTDTTIRNDTMDTLIKYGLMRMNELISGSSSTGEALASAGTVDSVAAGTIRESSSRKRKTVDE